MYILIASAVVIIGAGTFFVLTRIPQEEAVPEGFHRMEDGTLMRNDMGVEGMGALDEVRPGVNSNTPTASTDTALSVDPNAKVFEVTGKNFSFSTSEIRVKKGDTVVINFESTDGFHDWVLDEFNARTSKVQPGTPTSVTFVAEEAGTFEYYCSVGNHRQQGMVGTLIVEE